MFPVSLLSKLLSPPSKEKFIEIATSRIRRSYPDLSVDADVSDFSLKVSRPGRGSHDVFLGNVYGEFCAAPRGQRNAVLDRFLAILMEAPGDELPASL